MTMKSMKNLMLVMIDLAILVLIEVQADLTSMIFSSFFTSNLVFSCILLNSIIWKEHLEHLFKVLHVACSMTFWKTQYIRRLQMLNQFAANNFFWRLFTSMVWTGFQKGMRGENWQMPFSKKKNLAVCLISQTN